MHCFREFVLSHTHVLAPGLRVCIFCGIAGGGPLVASTRSFAAHCACRAVQGKSEEDANKAARLFSEIQQQIDSKQLKPFIRTQYMRSAFQVPG